MWESDHTIAIVRDLRQTLALRRLLTVHKSENPAWGKRGFLMEKRRVGTARFMTAADKGSTDNGAGSGPRL